MRTGNGVCAFLEHGGDRLGATRAIGNWSTTSTAGMWCAEGDRTTASPEHRHHRLRSSHSGALVRGAVLGHVEETFISQLKPKDVFFFAGRQLEFVRPGHDGLREGIHTKSTAVPAWAGGQMSLSDR